MTASLFNKAVVLDVREAQDYEEVSRRHPASQTV